MTILKYSFEEYAEMVKQFHGSEAPGVLIGGFMVALAVENMKNNILYDAISETRTCLPDAIQLLTPCTIGNGWLKIFNYGRYAVTLYDKWHDLHEGVRVFIDTQKMKDWPEISAWFFKLRPRKDQKKEKIIDEIRRAGFSILNIEQVRIQPEIALKQNKGAIAVCPECMEAYPLADGDKCLPCQNNILYR